MENQLKIAKTQIEKSIEKLKEDLSIIRTSQAGVGLVENIVVSYYGSKVPLKQVAQITTPAPDKITITPWDKGALGDVEIAIKNSNLNLSPVNDGKNIRLVLPSLTEERRDDLKKIVKSTAEETKIAIRNIRRIAWDKIQKMEKLGKVTEDDKYRGEDKLNKLTNTNNSKIDDMAEAKEKEISKV